MSDKKRPNDIKAAYIGVYGAIIAAIIAGIFALISNQTGNTSVIVNKPADTIKVPEPKPEEKTVSAKAEKKIASEKTTPTIQNNVTISSKTNGPVSIGNIITTNNNYGSKENDSIKK